MPARKSAAGKISPPADFDWNDDEAPAKPAPKGEPIIDRTVHPAPRGPLFGKWSAHLAYLRQREAELEESLEITREDIAALKVRAKESPDD